MDRYQVYGYYTDEPQVVIDIVDAENDEEAIAKVVHARGGEHSGYTNDGAGRLRDELESLMELLARPAEDVARDLADLAAEYAHWHETD